MHKLARLRKSLPNVNVILTSLNPEKSVTRCQFKEVKFYELYFNCRKQAGFCVHFCTFSGVEVTCECGLKVLKTQKMLGSFYKCSVANVIDL